ncbi:hypothetical protein [Cylindrospermum sp. FACHB-282]|uniref:hypothetical protein n=1 Tax=Cylindrospermum sp. FACHB-282 TaxID=2692794 RepID=UPI00168651B8|nr:hypothetical protein [Cylindrospermum sp. FACHB-282]MBD2385289.1 hypothetical protein [Cylindrospermum sp. FACHB-282]
MHRRINITLPEETIKLIDQVIEKGESPEETLDDGAETPAESVRSRFINEAVQYYINEKALAHLREQLKQGAIQRAERDLGLVEEWFDLEEEACQINEK